MKTCAVETLPVEGSVDAARKRVGRIVQDIG
jgi:hypothetical protein